MEQDAKEILGKDFLGKEAIIFLEDKLKEIGHNIKFYLESTPSIQFTKEDLQIAKEQEEMLVLRPNKFFKNGAETDLTLIEFRELFRKDPLGNKHNIFHAFEIGANDWYYKEPFAIDSEINFGWALVKKNVLEGSKNKTWKDQEFILQQYAGELMQKGITNYHIRRRTASEAIWDTILYYVNNNESLLENEYDWTQSVTSSGDKVDLGSFGDTGIFLFEGDPEDSFTYLGTISNR